MDRRRDPLLTCAAAFRLGNPCAGDSGLEFESGSLISRMLGSGSELGNDC